MKIQNFGTMATIAVFVVSTLAFSQSFAAGPQGQSSSGNSDNRFNRFQTAEACAAAGGIWSNGQCEQNPNLGSQPITPSECETAGGIWDRGFCYDWYDQPGGGDAEWPGQ